MEEEKVAEPFKKPEGKLTAVLPKTHSLLADSGNSGNSDSIKVKISLESLHDDSSNSNNRRPETRGRGAGGVETRNRANRGENNKISSSSDTSSCHGLDSSSQEQQK